MLVFFHHGWHFSLGNTFPIAHASNNLKDSKGHLFYEKDYIETNWEEVTLPHTFNDIDLFRDRIQDAGSGQKRTSAFYRNWLVIPKEHQGKKVLMAFEGMRQTCYLYVNEHLVGYYEGGTAPFGFDLTPWVYPNEPNLIAIATDNTTTRNIPFCIAETPNKPDVIPGSYLFSQMEKVPANQEGVPFSWNCNDFNPSVGGITRPVKIYFKSEVYLTLPLYSNLQTKGTYVYATDFDLPHKRAQVTIESEIRNESEEAVNAWIEVTLSTLDGETVASFSSEPQIILATPNIKVPLSITPSDAYKEEILSDGLVHYIPEQDESKVAPTVTDSIATTTLTATNKVSNLRFWSLDDPYLYQVEVKLFISGTLMDTTILETGFRKVGYDKDKGVLINDVPVWLTGYAQRATNEWAAIGIAPEWLKDYDAMLIKESNANYIRWMHVAASPADIRAFDRHGVACTQPAGDKEAETFGRQWDQRIELMRDIIIAFRNHPSILFWEAGNNSINKEHMREMRLLKEKLDPLGGRFMGCRTLNTEDVVNESEYVGTMLNRHATRFISEHGPITETEYSREEAPRRIWDDFTPPYFDYKNKWLGKGGKKQMGMDFYDLTSEDLALSVAKGYSEFFNDRIGGASKKDWYSACAALCWTDSAQHGRQSFSENGRMSGRVDPVRIKKQNFDVYAVMQSPVSRIKIFGHWNYPKLEDSDYTYMEKTFNGSFWEENGQIGHRDPLHKTVYVVGSYDIANIVLKVNNQEVGSCDTPINTFIFPIKDVNVTVSGVVTAYGYDYDGALVAQDELHTVGEPAQLNLSVHTSPKGLQADGADVAYVDIAVCDCLGHICPLCDQRIDFTLEGEGRFLGGYNSGRFEGFDKDDSVIHKHHVFAECGTNRVFIRSTKKAGTITLHAKMADIKPITITFSSKEVNNEILTQQGPIRWYHSYDTTVPISKPAFPPIMKADLCKYVPEPMNYCKVLVNGQEPDTLGIRSINENGRVWGAILCILERIHKTNSTLFDYTYDEVNKQLTLTSNGDTIIATAGQTHLFVNGQENLMDGEPYVSPEGIFVMEINAIVPFIYGVSSLYDEKVNVLRVTVPSL